MTDVSLFSTCPLPGCDGPTADPAEPCEDCKKAFGDYMRRSDRLTEPAVVVQQLAERDEAVKQAYAAQRAWPAIPKPAEPKLVEWRPNQRCWVCEERRKCRLDPDRADERWICKECIEVEV